MKNKVSDLRNHLFDAIEQLVNPDETSTMTVEKAQAIAELGKVIIDSAKVEVQAMKLLRLKPDQAENKFLEIKSIDLT